MPLIPRRRLLLAGVLGAAALSLTAVVPATSLASAGGNATSDAARGRVYTGLTKADAKHCGGKGFFVTSQPSVCTHGPDDAPVGVDVRTRRSTAELQAAGARARQESGGPITTAGATVGTSTAPTDGTGAIVCDGDGTTGPRVQVLYVHASDVPSRFSSLADTIGSYMLAMDAKYNASAQETGGSRHVRFVTESSSTGACQLSIREVVISPTGDDSFGNTITEVKNAGWDATKIGQPRRFLMLVDANVLCGIGQVYGDDQAAQTNMNNTVSGMYARADNGCWNYAEPHELMHNLGGVQLSAPHSTGAYHCNDEYDIECYNDGGSTSTLSYPCASSHESRFDCNHDDYYSTNPPAGSYLASHWNTAMSRFLIAPSTTTSTSTTTDTTPPAVPTGVTASASGSTVTVRWTLGTDADLAGYRVYRGGALVGSTAVASSWSQSVADGTYSYTVAAVDTTGNVSAQSAAASVTVAAGPTLRSESLSGVFSTSGTTAVSRTVAAGATKAGATSTVKYRGKQTAKPITVRVTDAAGNVVASGSGTGSVTVTWTAPASGALTWTLVGSSGASWTLGLSYYA